MTVYDLKPPGVYLVLKSFADYYGNSFDAGERLTFVERHFLPYDAGHTIRFKERNLYLQEETNSAILDYLGEYLAIVEEV